MPYPSTRQSQMDTFMGRTPALDANGVIDDISYKVNTAAKTADYTVKASESGTIFTNTGATAVVDFTLPAKAAGLIYYFFCTVDAGITVTADTADTMVTFNDVAADSVSLTTTGKAIGGAFMVFCDGTYWLTSGMSSVNAEQPITIATA